MAMKLYIILVIKISQVWARGFGSKGVEVPNPET